MIRSRSFLRAIAGSMFLLSTFLYTVGQRPSDPALEAKYDEAIRLFQTAMEKVQEGSRQSIERSIPMFKKALKVYQATNSRDDYASCLSLIGHAYLSLGEKRKALDFYNRTLPIYREVDDRYREARSLHTIGTVHSQLGEQKKALEFLRQALPIFQEVDDRDGEAAALYHMGTLYFELGEQEKALEFYERALSIYREIGDLDRNGEATLLNGIGVVYFNLGEVQKALTFYKRALVIFQGVGDRDGEALSLFHVGTVHSELGEKQKALEFFEQALAIHRATGDRRSEAISLNGIGWVHFSQGEIQKALEFYERALQIRREVGDRRGEATTLLNFGSVFSTIGKKQKALEFFKSALWIYGEVADLRGKAVALHNTGAIYAEMGDGQKALEFYERALPVIREAGYRRGEAHTCNHLMNVWRSLGNPQLASLYGKQAVNILQSVRDNIQGMDRETQVTFLGSVANVYRDLAGLLIEQGRIPEAEQVLAMLKEAEYFTFVRRDTTVGKELRARLSLSPREEAALTEYEKHAGEITRIAKEFEPLEKKRLALGLRGSLSPEDQKEYDRLKASLDGANLVFTKFLESLKVRFGEKDARVAAITSDTLDLLEKVKEPRTALISTIVGADQLTLIVTAAGVQTPHIIPVKAADLSQLVADFRSEVTNVRVDPRPSGKKLYDILFPANLKKQLDEIKADTIIWSLDGSLRYVPIAALWDGGKYLAPKYRNVVITLQSRSRLSDQATDRKNWEIFGAGVSKALDSFSPLPAVPVELCSIVDDRDKYAYCKSIRATPGVIDGLFLTDEEFTLKRFTDTLGRTPVVHIASHFSLNPGNEVDSFLLLGGGENRKFSIADMRKANLRNVDLLTLSACDTAMTSGTDANGLEVEGFAAVAQIQGARSILATLWKVADESTALWMSEFYRLKKENPQMSKAKAMQEAQIKMIKGGIKGKSVKRCAPHSSPAAQFTSGDMFFETDDDKGFYPCNADAPYSHPYYWAPFILIGNWR